MAQQWTTWSHNNQHPRYQTQADAYVQAQARAQAQRGHGITRHATISPHPRGYNHVPHITSNSTYRDIYRHSSHRPTPKPRQYQTASLRQMMIQGAESKGEGEVPVPRPESLQYETERKNYLERVLVAGYVKNGGPDIPDALLVFIFKWFHIPCCFDPISPSRAHYLDKNIKTIVQCNHNSTCTVYGSVVMPSIPFGVKHIWEYEIQIMAIDPKSNGAVAIGLDGAQCAHQNEWYWDKHRNAAFWDPQASPCYGFKSWNRQIFWSEKKQSTEFSYENGGLCNMEMKTTCYGERYDTPDTVIKMTYDSKAKTLSYAINGVDYGLAFTNIESDYNLMYRLAVYMNQSSTCVALL